MRLTLALFLAAAAHAAPTTCPPAIPLQDTVPLAAGCGLDPFVARPGATFWFGWNDNPTDWPGNDWDFDDLHGLAVVSPDGTSTELTYLGSTAAFWNTLYYIDPVFTNHGTPIGATATIETVPNADIILSLRTVVLWYGFEWSSFDRDHFRNGCLSWCEQETSTVPEPATWVVGLGLGVIVGVALAVKRFRRRIKGPQRDPRINPKPGDVVRHLPSTAMPGAHFKKLLIKAVIGNLIAVTFENSTTVEWILKDEFCPIPEQWEVVHAAD